MATSDVTTPPLLLPLPHCLSTLPTEITELILDKLSQPSLSVCARVNKAWNALCTPFFWRTVNVDTPKKLESFMTIEFQVLHRNATHIHNLCLCYDSVYNIFSPLNHAREPPCTNLRSLHIASYTNPIRSRRTGDWKRNYSRGGPLDPASESAVAALIRQNPGLKKLTVATDMRPKTLVPLLFHDLPNLQVLDCSSRTYDQYVAKILLELLPESIRHVSVKVDVGQSPRRAELASAIRNQLEWKKKPARRHPELDTLAISWYSAPKESWAPLLVPFLNSCSRKLATIHITGLEWFRNRQVGEELARIGYVLPQITSDGDLPGLFSRPDTLIAEYTCLSNQWRTINFHYCVNLGSLTIRAILERCEHLQHLHLGRCKYVSSSELRAILEKAPCLKSFEALDCNGQMKGDDPFMTAQDLITLDWGSLSLVTFNCRIVIARPDICDEEGEYEEDSARQNAIVASQALQGQVYRKLAEQRLLRCLCLGLHPTFPVSQSEHWYRNRCLEMTLESGLNELAGLQDLVWLHVGGMAPRIGLSELEWMVAHWPNLKYAYGILGVGGQDLLPGVFEWLRDNRIDWLSYSEQRWLRENPQ